MTEDNRPWADQYREAAEEWADKESAAQLLEDMKSAVMAQKQAMLGDVPVNRAEQTVKASRDWEHYVQSCVDARKEANLAKVKVEFLRMKFQEWSNNEANKRAEMRL